MPSFLLSFWLVLLCVSCQSDRRVIILVDGKRLVVQTRAATVDAVLHEQGIQLGLDDRVMPPGYTPLERTATIQIVRVEIKTVKSSVPVEFSRQFTQDESLPAGKVRVVTLGENGEAEVTVQVISEDGREISRREISRVVTNPPQTEVLAVGTQDLLTPIALRGTLVYLAHGNAWLMRDSSKDKRPLTFEGDLDGRVLELSPDGRFLLYTRALSDSLNALWLVNTVVLDEKPRRVPLEDLTYAEWAPDGSNQVAFSTGEKTPGAPGWKAHNDLNVGIMNGLAEALVLPAREVTSTTSLTVPSTAPISLLARKVLSPSVPAPYGWWGGRWAWAPDARVFAYAFTDQVGFVNPATGSRRAFMRFAFYDTHSDWVWTPQITWSPDSRFVAATVHTAPEGAGLPFDSPTFDLWVQARDNSLQLALVRNTGMWSFPTWSPRDANGESQLAYGVALNPTESERSLYALYVMDRDGSHRRRLYPQSNGTGLGVIQVAWSPTVDQLVAVRDGDLWMYDFGSNLWSQLTANGDSRLPRWR